MFSCGLSELGEVRENAQVIHSTLSKERSVVPNVHLVLTVSLDHKVYFRLPVNPLQAGYLSCLQKESGIAQARETRTRSLNPRIKAHGLHVGVVNIKYCVC